MEGIPIYLGRSEYTCGVAVYPTVPVDGRDSVALVKGRCFLVPSLLPAVTCSVSASFWVLFSRNARFGQRIQFLRLFQSVSGLISRCFYLSVFSALEADGSISLVFEVTMETQSAVQ